MFWCDVGGDNFYHFRGEDLFHALIVGTCFDAYGRIAGAAFKIFTDDMDGIKRCGVGSCPFWI